MPLPPLNPDTDLELTRLLPAPPAKVWRCFTEPRLLSQFWAPKPVVIPDPVIEAVPGGRFQFNMILPDGTFAENETCILDAREAQLLVFTDLMSAGFRPHAAPFLGFVGHLSLTAEGAGTRYVARAVHKTAEVSKTHAEMGFHDGWGTVADQLGQLVREI